MWDEEFKLLDRSYFLANIQGYFKYIVKKHKTLTDKLPLQYMSTVFKTGLDLKLSLGIFLNSLRQRL